MTEYHEPALLDEVLRWIDPRPNRTYVDCTVGGGGHAEGILATVAGQANLLGLDRDPGAIAAARERLAPFGAAVRLQRLPFSRLADAARAEGFDAVDGVLFDLGVSSAQLDRSDRGMSYRTDAPLDLRMDPDSGESAADLLARLDEPAIAELLFRFGEEPRGRAIARRIARAEQRPRTTAELAECVRPVAPYPVEKTLSRVFQALRIAVNGELDELESALPDALELLAADGRLLAISYHSLEDRIVKQFFVREAKGCVCPPRQPVCTCGRTPRLEILSRRAIRPSPEEVTRNRRARSARLRVARRLPS